MRFSGRAKELLARVREYLTMKESLRAAAADPVSRAAASEAAREGRQKRDAAELLLLRDSHAEALRIGAESLHRFERALELTGVVPVGSLARGLDHARRFRAELGTPPELDSAVTAGQLASLRGLLRAVLALDRQLDLEIRDRRGLRRLRRQRWLLVAMFLLSPIAVAAFARAAELGLHIRASSVSDDEYAADRAIDGDPDTEWIPAGGGEEWLELRFPPRRVETVRILNGEMVPDRAARKVAVEFYFHGEGRGVESREFDVEYPARWMQFSTPGIVCDRIRIVLKSHYGSTSAIAEIEVK